MTGKHKNGHTTEYSAGSFCLQTCVLTTVACLLTGCGNVSRKELSKVLQQTDSLSIFPTPCLCETSFYPSSKFGWGMMFEGMGEGATGGARWGAQGGEGAIITLPLGIVFGGIGGGVAKSTQGVSDATVSHFIFVVGTTLSHPNLGKEVAEVLHADCLKKRPQLKLQLVYWNDDSETTRSRLMNDEIRTFLKSLESDGKQLVLKISGTDYGFVGGLEDDQVTSFFMVVRVEFISTQDARCLYREDFKYKGPARSIEQWQQDEGTLLKEEFSKACTSIAQLISDEFFEEESKGVLL
ncbi:MAG: hypothetical protein GY809_01305 [Planctomycetes bacterium]|nr:hypothetical protein [Planctomycetota bacterium]